MLSRPGYSVIGILTLALGVGAVTAMFTAVDGVLLRPLPGFDSGRLAAITQESPRRALNMPAQDNFRAWQKEARSFESIAGQSNCPYVWNTVPAEQVLAPCVTADYFRVMGIHPLLGRGFLAGELRTVVLDHDFWRGRMNADPNVIGRELLLDRQPYRIVGVLPENFHPFGRGNAKFYTPFDLDRNPSSLHVIARIRAGVTFEEARAEMAVFDAREKPRDIRTHVTPLLDHNVSDKRSLLWTLFGAAAFVLLLACVNTAGLALVRGAGRQQEFAIRTALGATRQSLVRLSVTESLLLAVPGAAFGLGLAYGLLRLIAWRLASLPRADELAIDPQSLAFAAVAAIGASLASGTFPALRVTADSKPSTAKAQRAIAVAEVTLSFLLLAGAGLLLRSFWNIRNVDIGYRPANVWTAFFSLPETGSESESIAYERLRSRVSQIPGVEAAATATAMPTGGVTINMFIYREGEDPSQPRPNEKGALLNFVSPDYFRAAGIQLRQGRTFDPAIDRKGATPTAIVSQNVADRYFGGQAIGKRVVVPEIRFDVQGIREWVPREIVGVTANIRRNSITDTDSMELYLPEAQNPLRLTYLAVRTNVTVAPDAIRKVLAADFPGLPSSDQKTLEDRSGYLAERQRDGLTLLLAFGGLALLLAASGVFSVVSYTLEQRAKEMGIRMAVGATPGDLFRLILRETFVMNLIGLAGGVAATFALSRVLQSLLFGVSSLDALALGGSGFLLLICSACAALQPASKASRTDVSVFR